MNERKNTQVSYPDLEMTTSGLKGLENTLERVEPREQTCPDKVFMNRITLNEGISLTNFYSTWVFVLYLGVIALTCGTLEPQYLHLVLNVADSEMGKTTAWLYLVDYSVRFIFALVYGPMIDLYGRKFVMTIGIVLVGLGYFLIPIYDDSLFPGYFITKCLTSCGLIALQMLPFAADYVHDSTKGVMAGMNFGVAFIGGVVGATILKVLFWSNFSYKGIYWSLSAMIIIMGFIIRRGIKGGNSYYKQIPSGTDVEITDWKLRWKEIKRAFREIPWVPLSIIFGVLGNADIYIFTTGLVIWIKSLVPEGHDPTSVAANFQVVFFALSFFLTAAVALKIDRVSHLKLIYPILIVATLGFIAVPFVNSAYSPVLYIFFAIEGVSLPGVFVFSAYLSYRYNPPEIRGTLSGIGNGIGFLGAILILSVGGILHDNWRKDASFLLYAGLLFFTLIAVIILSKKTKNYQAKLSNAMGKLCIPLIDEVELNNINNLRR